MADSDPNFKLNIGFNRPELEFPIGLTFGEPDNYLAHHTILL